MARLSSWSALGTLLVLLAPACGASGDEEPDELGTATQAATATGRAKEGAACLTNPVYRKDKCAPGLKCGHASGQTQGVCVSRHAESEACEPDYGGVDCAPGLTCTARPGGGGFCKGAGKSACRVENGGLDCASGRTCVPTAPSSSTGTCRTSGSEGAPCDLDLIENECGAGFECVEQPGSTQGICTNPTAGGIGTPCGVGWPDQSKCSAPYICALGPELVGQQFVESSAAYRCLAPVAFGGTCVGIKSSEPNRVQGQYACHGDLSSPSRTAACYTKDASAPVGKIVTGICEKPGFKAGDRCGQHGVDQCGWQNLGNRFDRLLCVSSTCVVANVGAGQPCLSGAAPDGTTVNNCGWSYRGRQMSCVSGTCQP